MDAYEHWDRVVAAEADEQSAQAAVEAFGVTDPSSQWTPEYNAAQSAASAAWVRAEGARHDLDAFLNPERYAREGYRAEALDGFRARAAASAPAVPGPGPDREAT
jgi:hypothetical protein